MWNSLKIEDGDYKLDNILGNGKILIILYVHIDKVFKRLHFH